ncbi:zinc-ribbon-domain-containing protein [Dissophora ornata]|nr:zinc-ribbon-domain-containing protein [Dissophora ornata]
MSPHKPGDQKTNEERLADGSSCVTEDDLQMTYNNRERGLLGCQHYQRGCKLQANCCNRWFNCRFCHDDVCDHTIVRDETKNMLCMHCKTIQPAAQSCSSCKTMLARYYCHICRFWDDDPNKNIYHCEECGICRVGQGPGKDFFHCKKCNVCIHIGIKDSHKCIEGNLERDCPICGEYLFTSTITVIFMPCGHCIHSTCLNEYMKTSYQCPTCWKALGDMTLYYQRIDALLAEETIPPEYANIVSIILCNDCEIRSETPYHFLYHKCDKCKGYNTRVLEFKRLSDGKMEVVENATAAAATVGAARTAPESNLSGGSAIVAGPSSSSSSSLSSGSSSAAMPTITIPVLHFPRVPRPSLIHSEDSSFGDLPGSSGNSAP